MPFEPDPLSAPAQPTGRFIPDEPAPAPIAQPNLLSRPEPSPRPEPSYSSGAGRGAFMGAASGALAPEIVSGAGQALMRYAPHPVVKGVGGALWSGGQALRGLGPRIGSMLGGAAGGAAGGLAETAAERQGAPADVSRGIGSMAELAAGLAVPSSMASLFRRGVESVAQATARRAAGEASERGTQLSRTAGGVVERGVSEATSDIRAAEQRLGQISNALDQIGSRTVLAETRAAGQAMDPNAVADVRNRVFQRLHRDAAQAVSEAQQAGKSLAEAQAEALERITAIENQREQLRSAAAAYGEQLLSRPQIDAATFGADVRRIAAQAEAQFETAREQGARFGDAVESAGRYLRVDTKPIIQDIDNSLRDIRDPGVANPLREIRDSLTTLDSNGRQIPAINIAAADSLRKRLNRVINSRQIEYAAGHQGSAAAAVHHLGNTRRMLMDATGSAHPPYKEAVETWARLSSAPEFRAMQRGGDFRRMLTSDPLTGNELANNAEVVGQLLKASRGGEPVVEYMVARDPDLVNAAKYYFNRELFGSGRTPSVDQLGAFLRQNERPLRAFGLYNEFSTIRGARRAGQDAIETAEKALREARTVRTGLEAAETRAGPTRTMINRARGRLEEARGAVETPEQIAQRSAARAGEAERRLTQERREVSGRRGAAETALRRWEGARARINVAAPDEIAAAAGSEMRALQQAGIINESEYTSVLREIQAVEDAYKASRKASVDAEKAKKDAEAVINRWRGRVAGVATGVGSAALTGLGTALGLREGRRRSWF